MILIGLTIERCGYTAEFVIGIMLVNNEITYVTMFMITYDLQPLQPLNQKANAYTYTFDRTDKSVSLLQRWICDWYNVDQQRYEA